MKQKKKINKTKVFLLNLKLRRYWLSFDISVERPNVILNGKTLESLSRKFKANIVSNELLESLKTLHKLRT